MPKDHVVEPGEHLSGIAAKHGFADFNLIWNDGANASLRQKRKNPHVLAPGDVVKIPDRVDKKEAAETAAVHSFKVKRPKLKLRIVVQNLDRVPLAKTDCVLTIDGSSKPLTTDGDGLIEADVARDAKGGSLRVVPLDIVVPLKIGDLDPVEERSGQMARLDNLGYDVADADDPDEASFRSAVEEFQCDQGMKVTGECDGATQAKLLEVHGS